jgi:hypothetical protein
LVAATDIAARESLALKTTTGAAGDQDAVKSAILCAAWPTYRAPSHGAGMIFRALSGSRIRSSITHSNSARPSYCGARLESAPWRALSASRDEPRSAAWPSAARRLTSCPF